MSERRPELLVLSWEGVEAHEPRGVEICISVRDPGVPPPRLSPRFAAVLSLEFHDLLHPTTPEDVLFAAEHARRVLEFVRQWTDADRIVVHCHAGVSRSPGIALGLCDVLGFPVEVLERDHPFWNRWVRGVLARAAGERAPSGDDTAAP